MPEGLLYFVTGLLICPFIAMCGFLIYAPTLRRFRMPFRHRSLMSNGESEGKTRED